MNLFHRFNHNIAGAIHSINFDLGLALDVDEGKLPEYVAALQSARAMLQNVWDGKMPENEAIAAIATLAGNYYDMMKGDWRQTARDAYWRVLSFLGINEDMKTGEPKI